MNTVIEVENLYKSYGNIKAVNGISFSVSKGEIFGMLGPNGAGKTTTTEIVEGLRDADSGSVLVLGMNIKKFPRQVKSNIGVQLQTTSLYPRLTVCEVHYRRTRTRPARATSKVDANQVLALAEAARTFVIIFAGKSGIGQCDLRYGG